ncbi:MAG: DUF1223 domain-containing protein [Thermoanaerobaculia bacterium]|nr:DUF1223 domain-containing protein [Thermoanaerobaculia bacterium]
MVRSTGDPVVVELFTSQGCSSCPPADELLSELAEDPELHGRIVPLAFHVDYWNSIGWEDPFSSEEWSDRQRRYARALPSGRVYTPMLVVDGRTHMVGSREPEARRAIAEALARKPGAQLEVEVEWTPGEASGGVVTATARVIEMASDAPEPGELRTRIALFESGLDTSVPRGENRGRRLHNDVVVRRLATVSGRGGKTTFPLAPGWEPQHLGVAVFLQDPETMAILGAAADLSLRADSTPE